MGGFTTINGKLVAVPPAGTSTNVAAAAPAAAGKQTHHADCGDVGETGEHGDIGSNAADAKERQAK